MGISRAVVAILSGLVLAMGFVTSALADDWEAVKLRGAVFTLVDNSWVQLARGDVVSDNRIIRTAPNARVQLKRGKETIDLGSDTQIRIFDRDGQKFTVIQEHFGEVAIAAEHQDVQHFAVQTQYLAAVVKGTRFTVTTDEQQSNVSVQRGTVQVRDVARRLMVDITRGQSASVGNNKALSTGGWGKAAPVVSFTGPESAEDVVPVPTGETDESAGDSTSMTDETSTTVGTPAVANTADTPAADVVANTPAATKSPPGQNKDK